MPLLTRNALARPEIKKIIQKNRPSMEPYENIYKDFHQNPELSGEEARTAGIVAKHLKSLDGYTVHTGIGGHGLVGILKNGSGPTVVLRADMDALPHKEATGLPYASKKISKDRQGKDTPVMHACGHDMHVALLMGTAELLLSARSQWSGTLVCLFQPAEELAEGARAMIEDGVFDEAKFGIPKPDIVIGQHTHAVRAGRITLSPGPILTAIDSLDVRIFGRSGHVCRADMCIDPVLIAASIVVRLQGVVNKEVRPEEFAVVSCCSIHGGTAANIVPDFVDLKVTIRSYTAAVHKRMLAAVRRIIALECEVSGAPEPQIKTFMTAPSTINDATSEARLKEQFDAYFGPESTPLYPFGASEDFSYLAEAVKAPYLFYMFGCIDPELWDRKEKENKLNEVPHHHCADYKPVIQPTMTNALDAFAIAALTFLGSPME
ncbi:zinc metallopeptidase [Viridothelium virens]|uniref:Zinc metallopeptidase n=1 Tax=Viridothelium virens TaxID=1048519 RepID=A0A6A6HDR4_VIRVR|nr:zinc metallopeptidase [Viridothelium virens]